MAIDDMPMPGGEVTVNPKERITVGPVPDWVRPCGFELSS
jgi:hypothetical protein